MRVILYFLLSMTLAIVLFFQIAIDPEFSNQDFLSWIGGLSLSVVLVAIAPNLVRFFRPNG